MVCNKKKLLALVEGRLFSLLNEGGTPFSYLGVWEGNGIGLGVRGEYRNYKLVWGSVGIYELVCRGVGSRRCRGEEVLDGTRTGF